MAHGCSASTAYAHESVREWVSSGSGKECSEGGDGERGEEENLAYV